MIINTTAYSLAPDRYNNAPEVQNSIMVNMPRYGIDKRFTAPGEAKKLQIIATITGIPIPNRKQNILDV